MTTQRPLKLSVEPIVEAIIELRFDRGSAGPIALGSAYSAIASEFPNLESNPVSTIPVEVREANDGFKHVATHSAFSADRLSNVLLGDYVIAFCAREYGGWANFKARAFAVLEKVLHNVGFDVARASVRYVNLFDGASVEEQLQATTLKLTIGEGKQIESQSAMQLRTEFTRDGATVVLQVAANAILQSPGNERTGMVMDIDVIQAGSFSTFDAVAAALEHVHDIEREIFFGLMSDEALKAAVPIY